MISTIKSQLKNMLPSILGVLKKYLLLFLFIYFLTINPALISYVLDNSFDLKALMYLSMTVAATVLFYWSSRHCFANNRLLLYNFVLIIMASHKGFSTNCLEAELTILGLSVVSVIVSIYRRFIPLIPFICFAVNLMLPGFYSIFLISILVICYLTSKEYSDIRYSKPLQIFLAVSSVILYFVCLFRDFLVTAKEFPKNIMLWQCYNDYFHFGFITRGLIASLRYILFGPDSNLAQTYFFLCGLQTLSLIGIFYLIYVLHKKSKDNPYSQFLVLALLCSETLRNATDVYMIANFDNLLIFCLMLCVIWIIDNKYLFLIPVVISFCMLVHHGFGIFMFPALFIIFLYSYLSKESDKAMRKKIFSATLITTVLVVSWFVYFQFFAHLNNKMTFDEACRYIGSFTNYVAEDNLDLMSTDEILTKYGFFFVNIKYILYNGKVDDFGIQYISFASITNSIFLLLIMIPVYLLCAKNYKNFRKKPGFSGLVGKTAPYFFLIILLSYLEVDYGRWNSFIILSLIMSLLSALLIDTENSWINHIPEKYRMLVCEGLVIFMIIIQPMGVWAN